MTHPVPGVTNPVPDFVNPVPKVTHLVPDFANPAPKVTHLAPDVSRRARVVFGGSALAMRQPRFYRRPPKLGPRGARRVVVGTASGGKKVTRLSAFSLVALKTHFGGVENFISDAQLGAKCSHVSRLKVEP